MHFPRGACPSIGSLPLLRGGDITVLAARDGGSPAVGHAPHLNRPEAMTMDAAGLAVFWNQGTHQILRVTADGRLEVVAGTGERGDTGDGGPAVDATFGDFVGLTTAPDGTIFVADTTNDAVRAIGTDGVITTVVGGTTATGTVPQPTGVAIGPDGRLWIASPGDSDGGGILFVDTGGTLHTFLGSGTNRLVIDGQPMLFSPTGVAVDTEGDIWAYNSAPKMLVKFAPDGTMLDHWERYVTSSGVVAAPGGGVVLADYGAFAVERITNHDVVTVIPPNPTPALRGFRPSGVAVRSDGTIFASTDGVNGGTDHPALVFVDGDGLHELRVR